MIIAQPPFGSGERRLEFGQLRIAMPPDPREPFRAKSLPTHLYQSRLTRHGALGSPQGSPIGKRDLLDILIARAKETDG